MDIWFPQDLGSRRLIVELIRYSAKNSAHLPEPPATDQGYLCTCTLRVRKCSRTSQFARDPIHPSVFFNDCLYPATSSAVGGSAVIISIKKFKPYEYYVRLQKHISYNRYLAWKHISIALVENTQIPLQPSRSRLSDMQEPVSPQSGLDSVTKTTLTPASVLL